MKETNNQTSTFKEYYSRYLVEVRGLKTSSVKHYIDALNNISRRLKTKGLVVNDIYEIMDLDYLRYVRNVLYADSEFIKMDERGNRMYSSGLNNYYRFAEGYDFQNIADRVLKLDTPFAPEEPITITQTVYKRSNILKAQVLNMANYACEIDGTHGSFIAENTKKPYMEGHHAIPMKEQYRFNCSLDIYANIVCLCPLCHRRIHYGIISDREEMIHKIYYSRADRLANSGIRLSDNEFVSFAVGQR